jgi:hypothetical protein
MFARFAQVLWEELVGLADGLGITMERAALRFGNDGMRPPIGACSAAEQHLREMVLAELSCAYPTVNRGPLSQKPGVSAGVVQNATELGKAAAD